MPKLLYRAEEEAVPGIKYRVVLNEQDALELAIREMQAEEIVAIIYEKLTKVMEVLERHAATPIAAINAPPQSNTPVEFVCV